MKSLAKIAMLTVMLIIGVNAQAQQSNALVKIDGITFKGNLQTPAGTTGSELGTKPTGTKANRWAAAIIKYTVTFPKNQKPSLLDDGKWFSSFEINWKGVGVTSRKQPAAFRFDKTVKYKNVGAGTFYAVIFIDPKVVSRYFEGSKMMKDKNRFFLECTIKANEVEQASKGYLVGGKMEKKMPTAKQSYFKNTSFTKLENVFMDRKETPWAIEYCERFNVIDNSRR